MITLFLFYAEKFDIQVVIEETECNSDLATIKF